MPSPLLMAAAYDQAATAANRRQHQAWVDGNPVGPHREDAERCATMAEALRALDAADFAAELYRRSADTDAYAEAS